MRWLALLTTVAGVAVLVLFVAIRGASADPNVRIVSLACDSNPETVVIQNFGDETQSMADWELQSDPSQVFDLSGIGYPVADGKLDAGESITVFSGSAGPADDPSQGYYRWAYSYKFRNGDPTDYARLIDGSGAEVMTVHCGEVPPIPTPTPTPTSDSDNDGFDDTVEAYLGTDPLDACPDEIGAHDAWPLDINMDRAVTVVGDALNYRGRIGAEPGDPEWLQRLDFNMDSMISVVGDALLYRGMIGQTCAQAGSLTIHFIDVGQGDAILLEADGTTILVDGGYASATVEDYLQAQDIQDIDLMVATHPHADHIEGLTEVLALYDVHEIWTNGQTRDNQFYQDFAAAVAAEGATVREVTRTYSAQMGGLDIDVLHPATPLSGDLNEDSVVLQVGCGEVDLLLTGDATADSEASMHAAGQLSDVDVLKVGHHGSNTSTSTAFLSAITPQDAVISVGTGNPYGHPHQETLDRLAAAGVTVYRTDLDGTVILNSDCATYSIETAGS